MDIIKVKVKQNYGTDAVYVVSKHREAISRLTGRKTVTESDISALRALGFDFAVEADVPAFVLYRASDRG